MLVPLAVNASDLAPCVNTNELLSIVIAAVPWPLPLPLERTSHVPDALATLSSPHATVGTVPPPGSATGSAGPPDDVPTPPEDVAEPPHAHKQARRKDEVFDIMGIRSLPQRPVRSSERREDALHVRL